MTDRMKTQSLEFAAFAAATISFDSMCKTPIVDDDYPQVRHRFEQDLTTLVSAMRENERFGPGNPYRVYALPPKQAPDEPKKFNRGESCVYNVETDDSVFGEMVGIACTYSDEVEGWHRVTFVDGTVAIVRPSRLWRRPR